MITLNLRDTDIETAATEAASALAEGKIVVFPTDTIYGLAVDAGNTEAVNRLRALKGRSDTNPISIIIPSKESINNYVTLNEAASSIANRFLPGAITLVAPATSLVSPELMKEGTIGIRIPNDAFCLALGKAFGKPFTATSANKSGKNTLATAEEVVAAFGEDAEKYIALVVDGGPREGGVPSTVISFIHGEGEILREGAVSRNELGI